MEFMGMSKKYNTRARGNSTTGTLSSPCHQAKNYEQSQIIIKLYKDTTASRAVEQLKKSPPPGPQLPRLCKLLAAARLKLFLKLVAALRRSRPPRFADQEPHVLQDTRKAAQHINQLELLLIRPIEK
jgi:hypothetical protein